MQPGTCHALTCSYAPALPSRTPCTASSSSSPLLLTRRHGSRSSRAQPLRVIEGLRGSPAPPTFEGLRPPAPPPPDLLVMNPPPLPLSPAATTDAPTTSTSSAEADASRLFDFSASHIPAWSPSLALYFPLGVAIAAMRMGLWIAGILLDAPWFRNPTVVRTYLSLLGFKTTWRGTELLPRGRHVMVSNHVTPGDLMVLFQGLPQRYTHLITTALPPRVVQTHNLPCTLRFATPEVLEQLAEAGAAAGKEGEQQQEPVHLFPEGGVTNGRWGMMQFTRGFTRLLRPGDVVAPVALQVRTPWDIRTHTLLSSFPANLFWLSFCPWVEMEATVLPPMQLAQGEARGVFAKRVQQAIADHLGQVVSECNITVKKRVMQQEAKKRAAGK